MNILKKSNAILKISRPVNFLIAFASGMVAVFLCTVGNYPWFTGLIVGLSSAITGTAGNIINDIYDIEIDRINRPDRPLPSGVLSIREAYILYIAFVFFAIWLSSRINVSSIIIVSLSNVIIFLYSAYLKRIPLLGNIVVAFFTGFVFIYGGIAVNNWEYGVIPAVFAFIINFIREILKDIEDMDGDTKNQVFTFPAKFGVGSAKLVILILTITLIIATVIPYIFGIYNIEFFLIMMVLVNPILVFFLRGLYTNDASENLKKLSLLLKIVMIFGVIAIYRGI